MHVGGSQDSQVVPGTQARDGAQDNSTASAPRSWRNQVNYQESDGKAQQEGEPAKVSWLTIVLLRLGKGKHVGSQDFL